jgi:galactose mutarotase-like enzyme
MALLLRADAVSLELRPDIGGCIGAFRIERRGGPFDLMRPFGRSPGELSDALYSGMFPMLPFANCIRDNRFTFEGRHEVTANMTGTDSISTVLAGSHHGFGDVTIRCFDMTGDSLSLCRLVVYDVSVDFRH